MTERSRNGPLENEDGRRRLGERLREAREYVGLSQDDVAKHLGVPRTALSNIETGQRRVDALELQKLAELYRKPVSHLTADGRDTDALPADVAHLARTAASLSAKDREELERFAEYLRTRPNASARKK